MKRNNTTKKRMVFYNFIEIVKRLMIVFFVIGLVQITTSVSAQPTPDNRVVAMDDCTQSERFDDCDDSLKMNSDPSEHSPAESSASGDFHISPIQETVTGRVTDGETGEPLPGVNIIIQGTSVGTSTDGDGYFSIQVDNLNQELLFTYIGFESQTFQIDGETELSIALISETIVGDDIIVVAFGEQSREEFVGSAINITARDFANRAVTNPTQILEGSSPGVMFAGSSGQPGAGTNVRIRGVGSVSGSSVPLYVVDGAIFTGALSSINPNSIESMTVLKDAASTALYGSGAANGVIMITTKRGQSEPQISVNMSHGFVDRGVQEYDRVDAFEYYPLMWEGFRNRNIHSEGMSPEEAGRAASSEVFTQLGYNPFGQYYNDLNQYETDSGGNPILE